MLYELFCNQNAYGENDQFHEAVSLSYARNNTQIYYPDVRLSAGVFLADLENENDVK